MKFHYPKIEELSTEEDKAFWELYLSIKGKPDKGNLFLSYGKKYKDFLFSHQNFVQEYQAWFNELGQAELTKKCNVGSDLWFVYYDYASKDLYNYTVEREKESPQSEVSNEVCQTENQYSAMMEQLLGFYMMNGWMQMYPDRQQN